MGGRGRLVWDWIEVLRMWRKQESLLVLELTVKESLQNPEVSLTGVDIMFTGSECLIVNRDWDYAY
jgi:hypothetical protein